MSAETFAGAPIVKTLADVDAALAKRGQKVVCEIGSDADALHTNENRIVWIPADGWGERTEPYGGQEDEGHTIATSLDSYIVSIYAGDFGSMQKLFDDLHASLEFALSESAYKIESAKPKPRGGDVASGGWGVSPTITIQRPVFGALWMQGHVRSTALGAGVVDNLNAAPPETPDTI